MSVRFDGAYKSEQTRSRSNVNSVAVPNIPPKTQGSKKKPITQNNNPSVIAEISSKGRNRFEASKISKDFDKGDFFRSIHKAIARRQEKGINQKPDDPVYRLSAISQSANEGTTAQFVLATANVEAGSQFYYTISGVSAADVQGNSLSGSVTVDAQGRAIINISLLNDNLTEGLETLTVNLMNQASSISVNDTSLTPAIRTLTQSDITNPATQVFWDPANGGNGHIYEFVNADVTRNRALELASQKFIAGQQGYLVTLNNAVEDTFLQSIIKQDNNNSFFTSDPSSFWTGGEFLNGNWQWTSENQIIDSNSYRNWTGQESSQGNREPYIVLHMMTGYWFSLGGVAPGRIKGYIIEYDR